jgi:hypothetical protein
MKKELVDLEAEMQKEANDYKENRKNAALQSKVLQFLMNKEITAFHFPPGLNSDTELSATALWQTLVAEQPSDLHTIVCKCWDVRPIFDSLLTALPKLKVLRLENFKCTDLDLIKIAHHLTKLRSVLDFVEIFMEP